MSNIFGQTPSDISGALFQHKNLSDIPDKAEARENLDVPSKEEVLYSVAPLGSILPYLGVSAPPGYLPCYGQTISSTSFPDLVEFLNPGGSTAVIPDMRGEFLRGWDDGRGVDLGRQIRSAQDQSLQAHNHYLPTGSSSTSKPYPTLPDNLWVSQNVNFTPTSTTEVTTYPNRNYENRGGEVGNVGTFSEETRPRNIAVLYCIKAYSSIDNISSGLNLPGLISEYSALSADAARISYFVQNRSITTNGYQKLPGGFLLQWGVASVTSAINFDQTELAFTFPMSFPSSCLSVTASMFHPTWNVGTLNVHVKEYSNTSCKLISGYNSLSLSAQAMWFALGY